MGGADDEVIESHATLSSVFYLDDFGGPTVAFGQTQQEGSLSPASPTSVAVSFPHPNQLFVLRGDLFHGVLGTAQPNPEQRSRFTLLFNWWPERPFGPSDLPDCFAFGHSAATEGETPEPSQRRTAIEWRATVPFVESDQLPDWRAQRLPLELSEIDRGPGCPLVLSYPSLPDGRQAEGDWSS